MTDAQLLAAGQAICKERCAAMGEGPCYDYPGEWPAPVCEPDCMTLAAVALAAKETVNAER